MLKTSFELSPVTKGKQGAFLLSSQQGSREAAIELHVGLGNLYIHVQGL